MVDVSAGQQSCTGTINGQLVLMLSPSRTISRLFINSSAQHISRLLPLRPNTFQDYYLLGPTHLKIITSSAQHISRLLPPRLNTSQDYYLLGPTHLENNCTRLSLNDTNLERAMDNNSEALIFIASHVVASEWKGITFMVIENVRGSFLTVQVE